MRLSSRYQPKTLDEICGQPAIVRRLKALVLEPYPCCVLLEGTGGTGKSATAKVLAAVVDCIAFVLVTWVCSIAAAQSFKPDQAFYKFLALEMEGLFMIELIFLAVGLLLGCVMKQYKRSGSTAVAIILVTYILSVMSAMQSNLDFLKYFTPFKYFDAAVLLQDGRISGGYLLLSGIIIVVCVAVAYFTYNRRDLYI